MRGAHLSQKRPLPLPNNPNNLAKMWLGGAKIGQKVCFSNFVNRAIKPLGKIGRMQKKWFENRFAPWRYSSYSCNSCAAQFSIAIQSLLTGLHKVNMCLARYSPRHNHQPNKQQGTKWTGKAFMCPSKHILGKIWTFLGQKISFLSYGSFSRAHPGFQFRLVSLR